MSNALMYNNHFICVVSLDGAHFNTLYLVFVIVTTYHIL